MDENVEKFNKREQIVYKTLVQLLCEPANIRVSCAALAKMAWCKRLKLQKKSQCLDIDKIEVNINRQVCIMVPKEKK